jgi:hypothetical protein
VSNIIGNILKANWKRATGDPSETCNFETGQAYQRLLQMFLMNIYNAEGIQPFIYFNEYFNTTF